MPVERQRDPEHSTAARFVDCGYQAVVGLNDGPGYRLTHSDACFLSGEKWLEDLAELVSRDART